MHGRTCDEVSRFDCRPVSGNGCVHRPVNRSRSVRAVLLGGRVLVPGRRRGSARSAWALVHVRDGAHRSLRDPARSPEHPGPCAGRDESRCDRLQWHRTDGAGAPAERFEGGHRLAICSRDPRERDGPRAVQGFRSRPAPWRSGTGCHLPREPESSTERWSVRLRQIPPTSRYRSHRTCAAAQPDRCPRE